MNKSGYRDLLAWQRSMELAVRIFEITRLYPVGERFGLSQQMRRAAVSVPSNIAEGRGRLTRRDYRHFLVTARGSLFEMETQLLLSGDLGFLDRSVAGSLMESCAEVARLLNGLLRFVEKHIDE